MANLPWYLGWPFWALAVLFSAFYTWKCLEIFTGSDQPDRPWAWRLHQRWFNFLGSLAGWVALHVVARKLASCLEVGCRGQLGFGDAALFFVAFIGVTGYLPHAASLVLRAIREIAVKSTDILKGSS